MNKRIPVTFLISRSIFLNLGSAMSDALEYVAKKRIYHEWKILEDNSPEDLYNAASDSKNIIIENVFFDNLLANVMHGKNVLYIDRAPFDTFHYYLDNAGWGIKSSISKHSNWRLPITKLGYRDLLKFFKEYMLDYNEGGNPEGPIAYVPSRYPGETRKSLEAFSKLNQLPFQEIVMDSSFSESVRLIAAEFASNNGLNHRIYRNQGLRLNKCKSLISDDIFASVEALIRGIPVATLTTSVLSYSHVLFECNGNVERLLDFSWEFPKREFVDSVLYQLYINMVDPEVTGVQISENENFAHFVNNLIL